jgi:hypothetical protein
MVETGGSIFIALSLAIMLMALLPVCILFIRKVPPRAVLSVMSILCLFVFLRHLTLTFLQPGSPFISTGFKLAEFTLAFYLLKIMMISGRGKDLMNMILVSFLSVIITIYSLKGIAAYTKAITVIQAVMITVAALIILLQSISSRRMTLIDEPVFWLTGGLLCHYGMELFMEAITASNSGLSQQIQQQKDLVLMGTEIIQLAFFSVAAIIVSTGNRQNRQ